MIRTSLRDRAGSARIEGLSDVPVRRASAASVSTTRENRSCIPSDPSPHSKPSVPIATVQPLSSPPTITTSASTHVGSRQHTGSPGPIPRFDECRGEPLTEPCKLGEGQRAPGLVGRAEESGVSIARSCTRSQIHVVPSLTGIVERLFEAPPRVDR
jgi:hypothetical protein